MKVGDLVRLSAYGKDRRRADWIDSADVGIIVSEKVYDHYPNDYIVQWTKSSWPPPHSWRYERCNPRKDLKYVK